MLQRSSRTRRFVAERQSLTSDEVRAACHGGRALLLVFPEPLANVATAVLIGLASDGRSARRTMAIEEVSQAFRNVLAVFPGTARKCRLQP